MTIVLNSYGAALLRKDNMLVLRQDGKTHPIDPNKVEAIVIYKGTLISSDAIALAVENSIDIVVMDKRGSVKARMWSPKIGSIATIRRKQLEFTFSPKAVEWIKEILQEKITNQIALLMAFYPEEGKEATIFDTTINKLADYRKKIETVKGDLIPEVAPSLRGWEGMANKQYFAAINLILPDEYKFNGRSQHPARDIFNAMLNYAYGILYGKIEAALIRAGIDPYIGILHREEYNRPVLTFDVIEKYRVWADFVVIHLLRQHAIDEDCYSVGEDGSYWLEQMGRRILIQSMYDYLDDTVVYKSKKVKREDLINKFAFDLAKKFLTFKNFKPSNNADVRKKDSSSS